MKTKWNVLAWVGMCLLLILGAYGYGYDRGHLDDSRLETRAHLGADVTFYDQLEANKLDGFQDSLEASKLARLQENLKVIIYCESHNLRSMDRNPWHFLSRAFSNTHVDAAAKDLQEADLITQGMTVKPLTVDALNK